VSARRFAIALHAVSTSPAMPRWPEYVRWVEADLPLRARCNPPGGELRRSMRASPCAGLGAHVSATDLLTVLTSFVDDYAVEPPRQLFEVERSLELLEALRPLKDLTAPEQLALAIETGGGPLLPAVLSLHTVTRVLARGRDTRLHDRFALSLDERLERGRAILPFDPVDARGGDPLGDTYHFWANVAAGVFSAAGGRSEVRRHAVGALLLAGPALMSRVREGLFGNRLFFGNHARVDRLGLSIGYTLGRAGEG